MLFILIILSNSKLSPNNCFFAVSVCAFNSLPNGKYSNLLNVAAFSIKSFSGKTSLLVKKSYLQTFPDDKAEILAVVYISYIELCFAHFFIDCFDFLTNIHFYDKFFLICNGLSDDTVVSFTKSEYGSLV